MSAGRYPQESDQPGAEDIATTLYVGLDHSPHVTALCNKTAQRMDPVMIRNKLKRLDAADSTAVIDTLLSTAFDLVQVCSDLQKELRSMQQEVKTLKTTVHSIKSKPAH